MKILIVNVHSALNLGDEAIMRVTIEGLKKKFPLCEITVAANDPASWTRYSEIETVGSLCSWAADCRIGRFKKGILLTPIILTILLIYSGIFRLSGRGLMFGSSEKRRLLSAYYHADLVLSCGGGNYYAHKHYSPGLLWTLFAAYFAVFLGKRLIMLPQSIGPIKGSLQQFLTHHLLQKVDIIMLREQMSLIYLSETLGIYGRNVYLFDDLAFGLDSPKSSTEDRYRNVGGLSVGVTLLDRQAQEAEFTNQIAYEDALKKAILSLAQDKKNRIFLIVQCFGPSSSHNDRLITQRIFQSLAGQVENLFLLDTFDNAASIREVYGQMDLVIGTRMHTAVFSLSKGVPIILIGYQPKALGMMKAYNLEEYFLPIEEIDESSLSNRLHKLMIDRSSLTPIIRQRYQDIYQSRGRWLELIKE